MAAAAEGGMSESPKDDRGTRLGRVDRSSHLLTQVCLTIGGSALVGVAAVTGSNVTSRVLFGLPFSWAEELMLFLMLLAVFSGAIAITWRNMHIRIDTFVDAAPPLVRKAALVVNALASIGVIGAIVYAS